MNYEMNHHLVKAIVDVAIFLEFSDDGVIDPDAATQALEQMAAELQLMDVGARESLCSRLNQVARTYSGEKADFVGGLSEVFGLE